MSYDENELVKEGLNFKMDDEDTEEEPMEPIEGEDDFKFDEEPEEDPDDKYH